MFTMQNRLEKLTQAFSAKRAFIVGFLVVMAGLGIFGAKQVVNADCQPIFGGGKTCASPTPAPKPTKVITQKVVPVTPTPTPKTLPIFPTTTQPATTPSTGPEALPLLALIPTALAGVALRKQTK